MSLERIEAARLAMNFARPRISGPHTEPAGAVVIEVQLATEKGVTNPVVGDLLPF
jgi:hypothetical protein